jgi:hypothetical protein
MMEAIVSLVSFIFIGATSALFTDFLFDCLQDGMIFEKWGRFVDGKFWFKPLGGCIICTNFWITAMLILLCYLMPLIVGILFIFGLSNYLIKKLNE